MQPGQPLFSICIPQYNRTSFLLAALESLVSQSFRDFEVCISDDASTDGREAELMLWLEASGLNFRYERQPGNLRYDANLRAAIALARGRYVFMLGNDDGIAAPTTLQRIAAVLRDHDWPGVALTNYREAGTGFEFRRVSVTGPLGSGPDVAIRHFRSFSFVSGVILSTQLAHEHATARWDGSEMYQVYLVSRSIAQGAKLLGIADIAVVKDLQVPGEKVDSYAARPRLDPCPIVPRKFNLASFPGVVSDAVAPYVDRASLQRINTGILEQLYAFTFPYWLIEFRRVQSWKYALGIALGQRPRELTRGLALSRMQRMKVELRFLLSTIGGLLLPVQFTRRFVAPAMYRIAKRARP